MMRLLFLFLLLPSCLLAQESEDYLKLIREDLSRQPATDSSTDMRLTSLRLYKKHNYYTQVRSVRLRNGKVEFIPIKQLTLSLGGNFTAGYAFKSAGPMPVLQNTYAQGRNVSGTPAWRGAETGEMFSYGPALSSLEYSGGTYPYDANGPLVPSGAGNGIPAKAYDNDLLRTGSSFYQSFSLIGNLSMAVRNLLDFNIRMNRSNEQLMLPQNRNEGRQLDLKLNGFLGKLEMNGSYLLHEDQLTNSSRNGFLQRVYRNMLLTPSSFSNSYVRQTAYGDNADNPYFLLDNNGSYFRRQQQGSLGLLLKLGSVRVKALQSYEDVNENANESYLPGTAGFPAGAITLRDKHDRNYFLQSEVSYYIPETWHGINMETNVTYVFTDNRSNTVYRLGNTEYDYQRSAGNLALQYNFNYDRNRIRAGIEAGAQSYFSNTAPDASWMMPQLGGHISYYEDNTGLEFKTSFSYRELATELPVYNSLAYANLLRYSASQANLYLPNTEVSSFDGLDQTKVRAWTAGFYTTHKQYLRLTAEIFSRQTNGDVFPLATGNRLELRNLGSHRRNGWELSLEKFGRSIAERFTFSFNLSFTKWKQTVTAVANSYDYTPLAGFSDVYKVMAKDMPFGAIMGSAWQRDASGQMVIGADGFPLVAPQPKIIGNPVPDFIVKLSDKFSYKKFTLQTSLEWRKGGDVWNGTAAVLDYYGRSAKSGEQRNTGNYVFPGVTVDGHPNTTPVRFNDPSKPLDQSRWVRYGYTGVAEDYIEKGDCLRLQNVELSYFWTLKKIIRKITVSATAGNIILWKAYSGSDPDLLLFDQPTTAGLDFFQLPSLQTYGLQLSVQF